MNNFSTGFVLPRDTLISTKKGLLFAHEVIGAIPRESAPVLSIATELGLELELPADACVAVIGAAGKAKKPLGDIATGDIMLASFGREAHGQSLDLGVEAFGAVTSAKASFMVNRLDTEVARMLGYIISECNKGQYGSSYAVRVAQNASEAEVVDDMQRCFSYCFGNACRKYENNGVVHFGVNRKDVYNWLTQQGVGDGSGGMTIPRSVRMGPAGEKAAFLSTMFEGDGSVSSGKSCCIKLTSKSRLLVAQTQLELMNLGIAAVRWHEERKGYGRFHNLQITTKSAIARFDELIGFVSERKRNVHRLQLQHERSSHTRDLPQSELKWLFERVSGPEREKIRECLRENARVRFANLRWPIADRLAEPESMPTYVFMREHHLITVKVRSVTPSEKAVPMVVIPSQGGRCMIIGGMVVVG